MSYIVESSLKLIKPIYRRSSFHRSVIEEVDEQQLRNAYATCRSITKHYAKTFYMATRFLPNHKQRSIFAIYALCRYLDNLVDEAEDLIKQKKINHSQIYDKLVDWKSKLQSTYDGNLHDDAILYAFSDVLKRYYIPIDLPFLLVEGVYTDQVKNRFQTFEEVYDYSYKVASVVGLITSKVFGYQDPTAKQYAIDLGIAMQLTNIIRDVGEDIERGRIYLPMEDLHRFNVDEQKFLSGTMTPNTKNLLAFQVNRARSYYQKAEPGIQLLDRDSRLPVYLASRNYSRILDKVEENNYDVFSQRAYLNSTEKLRILPKVWFQMVC